MSGSKLRLALSKSALASNWLELARLSGGTYRCGAAVKANAYGIGLGDVLPILLAAGCRDFFVATWDEAEQLAAIGRDAKITVLNGVFDDDLPSATSLNAKPMLNSLEQAARWRATGLPCDVMINSGMNRLGINPSDAANFDWSDFKIDLLASHLASADEDTPQNASQLADFLSVAERIPHLRKSMANSAGIALAEEYHFDLTRPGLSIYGGIPRAELTDKIRSVGGIETRLLQVRELRKGDKVGYNATYIAGGPMKLGIIAIGYADGYLRGFSGKGEFFSGGNMLPVVGRVSMDLVALDLSNAPGLGEGDAVSCPLDLPALSRQSGLSQYEVITGLGRRFERIWQD